MGKVRKGLYWNRSIVSDWKRYRIITGNLLLVLVFLANNNRLLGLRPSQYDGLQAEEQPIMVHLVNDRTNHSWWVPKRTREQRLNEIDNMIDRYTKTDESHLDILHEGIYAVLEMADPRSRYCFCFEEYYKVWKDEVPFSGESFFDWFDFGSGRIQNLKNSTVEDDCDRATIGESLYYKATPREIADAEVEFEVIKDSGRMAAYYVGSGLPVPEGTWSIIWTLDHRLLLHSDDINDMSPDKTRDDDLYYKVGHCSFTCGLPVLFAGEIGIALANKQTQKTNDASTSSKYEIALINSDSGHYQTDHPQARLLYQWVRRTYKISQSTIDWPPWKGCKNGIEWREHIFGNGVVKEENV